MRRYLSLMERNFPTELGNAYRSMENQGNPWGMSQGERGDWADKLDGIDDRRPAPTRSTPSTSTGSAAPASFDDKNKKVTQAMAKLLQRAGIDFAILGPSEMCTGDPARRSGNEYLFQMLAMPNIETLNGMGVKKIITQCPHCFNTLKNEYPQLGGNYEVVHHSQFLEWLIETGKLDVSAGHARGADRLPRLVLPRPPQRRVPGAPQGDRLARGHRDRRDASATAPRACAAAPAGPACGWRSASASKVNDERAAGGASPPGASRVATACPFCYIMIDDGVKGAGRRGGPGQGGRHRHAPARAIEAGERKLANPAAPLHSPSPASSSLNAAHVASRPLRFPASTSPHNPCVALCARTNLEDGAETDGSAT